MQLVVPLAIAVGLALGALLGYLCARWPIRRLAARTSHPSAVVACAWVAVLASAPVAVFLSFSVGGNLGAAWSESLFEAIGFNSLGVSLGLVVGIAFVLSLCLVPASIVGAVIGFAVLYVIQRKPAA